MVSNLYFQSKACEFESSKSKVRVLGGKNIKEGRISRVYWKQSFYCFLLLLFSLNFERPKLATSSWLPPPEVMTGDGHDFTAFSLTALHPHFSFLVSPKFFLLNFSSMITLKGPGLIGSGRIKSRRQVILEAPSVASIFMPFSRLCYVTLMLCLTTMVLSFLSIKFL